MAEAFLVVGAGRFGTAVALTLDDLGRDVIVVDHDETRVAPLRDLVAHAAVADATDEAALRRLGVRDMTAVVIAIGHDLEASILTTVAAKTAGALHVISKADDDRTARILATVGADEVVRPEHDMGRRLAEQLARPSQIAALELGAGHSVVDVDVGSVLHGTLRDIELPRRFDGAQVLAIRRGSDVTVTPPADFVVRPDDRLVVLGSNEALDELRRLIDDGRS